MRRMQPWRASRLGAFSWIIVSGVVATSVGAHAALVVGANVNISRAAGYQAEEAIAINPTNPLNLFAFSNTSSNNLFGATSFDGGATWTGRLVATGVDIRGACCDPTGQFDRFGNLFISYIDSGLTAVNIATSVNGGVSFANLFSFAERDQPTLVTGPSSNAGINSTWVTYQDTAGTIAARNLAVTGLNAFGALSAEQLAPGSGGGNFGDIAVGPGGKTVAIYQKPTGGIGPSTIFSHLDSDGLGAGGFGAARSATTTNVGGFAPIPAQPNRTIDSEVSIGYDTSGGAHNGRLYMAYTDRSSVASTNTDILFRYSDDDGVTWSAPILVNDDAGVKSQFFPKISVDPVTGHVAIVWYDARNSPGNNTVQVFGSISIDGGLSFLANVLIAPGFSDASLQSNPNEFGDFLGISSYNDVFHPVWADNSNSTGDNPDGTTNFDIYTATVTFFGGVSVPEPSSLLLVATAAFFLTRAKRRAVHA